MSSVATIYDIARQANVSIATVSRVLNNSPRVSERTRARVVDIAESLGYQPNHSARSLARQVVPLVSAVIPMMTSYFYLEVLQGVQDRVAKSDYDLIVYSAPSMEGIDTQLKTSLQRGRASGMLLFSTMLTPERVKLLEESSQPVALVDRHHPYFDSVSLDNQKGGYLATRHLLERGRRKIGLLQAHPDSKPGSERRTGYEKALTEAGIPVEEDRIIFHDDKQFHGYTEEAGYQGVRTLLENKVAFDALFATSDIQALGAMRALREQGIGIPDDVAVIGFDDVMISRFVGLSTLAQPMYKMGQVALDLLLQRLSDENKPVEHMQFEPQLVVRESTTSKGI